MKNERDKLGRARRPGQNRGAKAPLRGDGGEGLKCPVHLSPHGREGWMWLHSQMKAAETLDSKDASALELFATAYERMRQAKDHIEEHGHILVLKTDRGSKTVRPNPSVHMEGQALDRMLRILEICGVSLRARAAMGIGAEEEEVDPFSELLNS